MGTSDSVFTSTFGSLFTSSFGSTLTCFGADAAAEESRVGLFGGRIAAAFIRRRVDIFAVNHGRW